MSGKYHYKESAVSVARPLSSRSVGQEQARFVGFLASGFVALLALALVFNSASVSAEGRLPLQMEFSRAPAPVAEANAPIAVARDGSNCENCASQAKIVLAWQYPVADEFMVFFAPNPSAEFSQITPQSPAVRTLNGEYEIQIDAGTELGASVGEQVCFKVQAASVIGDVASSSVMCSELQS